MDFNDVRFEINLKSVDVEMRCKECGNGVSGMWGYAPDEIVSGAGFFRAAAENHDAICKAQHRPLQFEFEVVGCKANVR